VSLSHQETLRCPGERPVDRTRAPALSVAVGPESGAAEKRSVHGRKAIRKIWALRAALRRPLACLVLKGANTALTAISSFLLAYVLVRTIGIPAYAMFAGLMAFAALVVQSDLGITGLTFSQLRAHYLADLGSTSARPDDRDLIVTTTAMYAAIAVGATCVLSVLLWFGFISAAPHGAAYLLIFAGAVCALPRMPLRVAIDAREGYLWSESVDLARRVGLLIVALLLLRGLPFTAYSALSLAIWVCSIGALALLAARHGYGVRRRVLRRGMSLLRAEMRGIRASVRLSLLEFSICIFPYYLLPFVGDATAVVAFDMFYKVTRFATMSYLIGSETVLPSQTRAVHRGDGPGLARATGLGIAVGLFPMIIGIVGISVFGQSIFGTIVNHPGIVSPTMRGAICVMFIAMLIHTTCAVVLIGVGRIEMLARRSTVTFAGMLLLSGLTMMFHWDIDRFIIGYTVVFSLGVLLHAQALAALVRSLPQRPAEPA
jgi:O-antigen/teichoic acid export membrane protein